MIRKVVNRSYFGLLALLVLVPVDWTQGLGAAMLWSLILMTPVAILVWAGQLAMWLEENF